MQKKIFRIILIITAVLTFAVLLAPDYIGRAILHGNARINNYRIFENRLVQNAKPIPWQHDAHYNTQKIEPPQLAVFDP
jgi:hypothetical protein